MALSSSWLLGYFIFEIKFHTILFVQRKRSKINFTALATDKFDVGAFLTAEHCQQMLVREHHTVYLAEYFQPAVGVVTLGQLRKEMHLSAMALRTGTAGILVLRKFH